jgi:hypothetical protein
VHVHLPWRSSVFISSRTAPSQVSCSGSAAAVEVASLRCRGRPSMRVGARGRGGGSIDPIPHWRCTCLAVADHDTAISAAVVLHSFPLLSRSGHLKTLIYLYWQIQLRASPTMSQTSALNWNIGLYTGKTTPTVLHFIKFCQKTIRHSLKWLKYTTP